MQDSMVGWAAQDVRGQSVGEGAVRAELGMQEGS